MLRNGGLIRIVEVVNIFYPDDVIQILNDRNSYFKCKIISSCKKSRIGDYFEFGKNWDRYYEVL